MIGDTHTTQPFCLSATPKRTLSTICKSALRKLVAILILGSSVSFLALHLSQEASANRDFISYWAAAQLLMHRQNPYGSDETLQLERSAGCAEASLKSGALMIRNPPFCLPLLAPLGWVGAREGAVIWSLLIIACLVTAVRILWDLNGKPPDRLHLLSYLFAPALACILAGQSAAFVLLGLVLFLKFHRSRPFLAGLTLMLAVTMKPHFFVAFGIVLIFQALTNRQYRVVSGALTGIVGIGLAATILDPHCWVQYPALLRAEHLENKLLPNLSLLFRLLTNRNAVWLQSVPIVVASVWAFWYARRHRNDWDWMAHGSLLMLISVIAAPYSWLTDEIILLPAVLHGVYTAEKNGRSLGWFGLCAGTALMMVFRGVPLTSLYYIWTPLPWLATYAYATRSKGTVVTARPNGFYERRHGSELVEE